MDAKVFESMAIKIRIPTPLQKFTQNRAEIKVDGNNVAEVLSKLDLQFPGMRARLYDDQGHLRRFINFFLNDEDIRFLAGENTPCKPGDTLSIIPAIAGGVD